MLVGAVGTYLAGGAHYIAHLQVILTVLSIGQSLGNEERLLCLPGDLPQGDHRIAGAQGVVGRHIALNVYQGGVVLVAVQVAELKPVVQRRIGQRAIVSFGLELGGVHVHCQLAVGVGGVGDVGVAGNKVAGGAAQMDAFTVVAGQVHAAPEGNGAHIGGAVRLNQIQIHLGGGRQGNGVEGIELQLGGVPLTAGEGAAPEGSQIGIALVAGAEHHVALDAAGLVEGQQAVAVGGGRYFYPVAVGIGEGGFLCRGHLEQVEFLPQGVYIYLHTVGHTGGGVGGGDSDIFGVIGGGNGHLGLGHIGLIGEILNVVPQTALAVVDAHRLGVVGNPLDAVADAAPVVGVGVDADVLDEAQLLAQGQDVFALGGQCAADLGLIAQVDGFPILAVVQDLQCTVAVDPQHQRVGAGGKVGTGSDRVLRKGNGIGVVETAGHRQRLESDCAAAVGQGGIEQAAAGNVFSVCRAVGHPLDGQGAGSAVIADGAGEGELLNVLDGGLVRREAHFGGR